MLVHMVEHARCLNLIKVFMKSTKTAILLRLVRYFCEFHKKRCNVYGNGGIRIVIACFQKFYFYNKQ